MIIKINPSSATPIYEQLRIQVISGIASGKLVPGEVLPSVRNLGADLGVNFHTVNKAYAMLCDEGYLIMNRRQGAVIAKPIDIETSFLSKLSKQISLSSAEAICHGLGKDEFIKLCGECYQMSKGEGI